MESNEAHELMEEHERAARDQSLRPIAFLMSLLAVLVAIATVLGHRSATEAVLAQARASDQWSEYQAQRIRQHEATMAVNLLSTLPLADAAAADNLKKQYLENAQRWSGSSKEEAAKAREYESDVRRAERREDRFDLGEALLEIGLVITSISLLTRQRIYAAVGGGFGAAGVLSALLAFFVR